MKKTVFKRAAAFVLAFGMILQLSGCTSQDKEPMKIMFHPSTAEFEAALFTNPDRGFRLESYTDLSLHSTENNKYNITQWNDKFQAAAEKVKEGIWAKPKLTQVYCYLTEYRDTETLPDIVFQNLDAIFQALKQEKMKGVIRFAYQGSMEAKNEQASQEIMLAHMEQLAPVLEKYKDLIHTVEAGFMGAWGEWHSYPGHTWDDPGQISNEYFDGAVILRGILDMVPDDIYVQVRYPGIGELIDKEDPDHMRLGLNNDAFFGFRNQAGAWPYEEMGNSHCHKAQENSLTAPMGGEFFWGCQWNYVDVTAEEAIKMFVRFHQNSFSVYHNSFEGTPEVAGRGDGAMWFATDREGDMSKWIHVPVTAAELESWGAYVSPSYFVNSRGEAVERSAFEYVRDHLGYRIEAKELTIDGRISRGETVALSMDLVNYGFSAAFNMTGEFVVLDEDYNIVSRVTAGDPSAWNNLEGLTTHTVSAELALPKEGGSYKIAYYLHNSNDEGAYFANDFDRFNGFNILYAFEL